LFSRISIENSIVCFANTPSTFITLTFWSRGGRLGSYDQGTVLHDCPAERWVKATSRVGARESRASIISAPEIVSRFQAVCPACRITIKKESADYIVVFAATQAQESGGRWSWAAYENKDGLLLRQGETVLFNNSIKDAANLIWAHWRHEDLPNLPVYDPAGEKATVFVYRKEGGFKTTFNPSIQLDQAELVDKLTKNKYFAVEVTPGQHIFTFKRRGAAPQQFIFSAPPGTELYIEYDSGSIVQPMPSLELRQPAEALKEILKLKPEEKKNILDPQRISDRKPNLQQNKKH
jgi:hypothetical protein